MVRSNGSGSGKRKGRGVCGLVSCWMDELLWGICTGRLLYFAELSNLGSALVGSRGPRSGVVVFWVLVSKWDVMTSFGRSDVHQRGAISDAIVSMLPLAVIFGRSYGRQPNKSAEGRRRNDSFFSGAGVKVGMG